MSEIGVFGIETFRPWVGLHYCASNPKIMVLGESRYDEDYSDNQIIEDQTKGCRQRTHTNFLQAVIGTRYWEDGYSPLAFWEKSIFYNYHTEFYPERARVPMDGETRDGQQNRKILRCMLDSFKPTHCIVWGVGNWKSIAIDGINWGPDLSLPGVDVSHPYRSIALDGCATLFSHVRHPSAGFAHARWKSVLAAFLALKVDS
jgi:hypothetical protein